MAEEPTGNAPLQIPSELLNRNYIKPTPRLQDRASFEVTRGNEFIEIEPPVLKFAGYELGKLNSLKLRIINKAPVPQRINVLGPSSPLFSIRTSKKGWVSTGMSEEVEVILKPNEFKYLYESIRVSTETENFIVPVHAFPVMDRAKIREVFPKLIDFGTQEVGTSQAQSYPLHCNIPLNFEFEIVFTRDHPDIKVSPLKGVVPGLGSVEIAISYEPVDLTTAVCEAELRVSQFDFEPVSFKIMGSGRHFAKKKKESKLTSLSKLKQDPKKSKDVRISSSKRRSAQELPTLMRAGQSRVRTLRDSEPAKGPSRAIFEKEFIQKFNTIQNLDKEKEIKFFKCIGNARMTEEEQEEVRHQRARFYSSFLDVVRQENVERHQLETGSDLMIYELSLASQMGINPTWDPLRNNQLVPRRLRLKSFVNAASRLIVRHRMLRRLAKLKEHLRKVKEDSKSKGDADKEKVVVLKVQLGGFSWPYQYEEGGLAGVGTEMKVVPRAGFDDLCELTQLQQPYAEVFGYSSLPVPPCNYVYPVQTKLIERRGAEQEYAVRGAAGIKQLESSHSKTAPGQADKKEKLGWLPQLGQCAPPECPSYHFLLEHPFLRVNEGFLVPDESYPEFYCRREDRVEDECVGWKKDDRMLEIYRWAFTNSLGMDGVPYGHQKTELKTNL